MNAKVTMARAALLALALGAAAMPARAQQILLEPVRAGKLTLFRDLTNEKVYYYVSDRPRLAVGDDGKPDFSFLRWVENVRSAPGQPEVREGDGGGIVHAMVTLSVTPEEIQEAQSELQRQRPGGVVRGPVMYKQGTFGLVSSFKQENGDLVKQVVGLGKAPLLDGERAAVSFQLTKRGAQILWESLQTPRPDISFTFEMQMDGFKPPARAILEVDFDQVYSHTAFGLGAASTYLAADVSLAFDELRRNGAIKLTEIGDNAELNSLINTAYNKVAQVMFDSAPDILKPAAGLGPAAGAAGAANSFLDRATSLLSTSRADHDKQSADARAALAKAKTEAEAADRAAEAAAREAELREKEWQDAVKAAAATPATTTSVTTTPVPTPPARPVATPAPSTPPPAPSNTTPPAGDAPAVTTPAPTTPGATTPATPVTTKTTTTTTTTPTSNAAKADAAKVKRDEARAAAAKKREEADRARAKVAELEAQAKDGGGSQASGSRPNFAIVASFQMKRFRQTGKMKWDLNKYTESTVTLRFDGNIGDVRQYKDHFREVNLSSPLYEQREISVYVDGATLTDFAQYVNFVTVRLRKKHAGGAVTDDEVTINRTNFNQQGNSFKLLYGWKGDNDRRHWMDYEYQTVWSLFGGKTITLPMTSTSAQAIPVNAPYERHTVELRATQEELAAAEVRSVNVKLYYDLGGAPQMKQATLDASRPQSTQIDFMSLPDAPPYEYEITWRLKGNRTLTSGRQKGGDTWIDLGDVPAS
jgi:hypothetical protein